MSATACVVACAPPPACILFWQRRLGSCHSQPVFWVGGGSPKTPRTEQRRRRSYHRSLELSSIYSVYSLGCRGTWQIKLGTKLGLRSPSIFFRRHRRGTLCCDLLQNRSRERGCCLGRHSLWFTIHRLGGGCR